jgi:hypothetical protein
MPPPDLMQHFEAASAETGIPVPVLVAQARQESNFNPQARGRAGEIGVMQIMPSTARQPGFGMAGVDPATLDDPGENIRFGARYLRARGGANADFNDPQALATALRNYNGGGDPRYVENVMRFMPQDVATPAALNPAQMPQAPAAQAPAVTPPSRRGASDTVTIGGQNFSMRGIMAAMSDPDPQVSQYARTLFTAAQSQERESFGQPTEMTDANGQRVMVQVGNRGTIRPVQGYSAPPAEPRQSDIERRIDLMVQNGVPREMAVGLSTNQFETRQDPQDGTITIIDRSNGRVLFGPNAGGIIGQPAAPAAPAAPGAPGAPAVPGAPGNVDFRGATGAPGLVAETANFVADLFGGRNLPAPQVAAGAQALRNLDTRTRMFLQSAIPGRPSNYLMEMIGGLTVSPAEIRLGPERATERVQQTTRFLEQTVRELEEIAGGQGTGRFTRQDIGEANRVLVSLRPLLNDYRTLEGALTSRPERAPPPPRRGTLGNRSAPAPAGVDPQLWNVMTPEERALWQN